MRGRDDLDAIHIVAHGAPGEVNFSTGPLSIETIDQHADELAVIGQAVGGGALMLWSCEAGLGERGAQFIEELATASGAEVSAPTGLVGAAAKGGRWELDARAESAYAHAPITADGIREV